MKKKLIFRTAKLLSDTRKRSADTGAAIAYEHQPKDQEEKKHGSLFAVVEISGPSASSEEIVELIIDTFHNEYYRDLDKEPLESLESALAKINEELADITEQGKIHWLGKLNAVLGVLNDRTLHVTQAGKAEAYLFRKENMAHITKDLTGDNINPLRTFINIASGDLSEDDKVGLFSPGIFFHISKDELKKYISEFNPNTAIGYMAELLEGLNGQRRSSALVIEMLTPETLANYTLDSAPDEVWVQETKNGVEAITKGVSPIVLTAAKKSAGFYGSAKYFIEATLIPFISTWLKKGFNYIKSLLEKKPEAGTLIEPREAIASNKMGDDNNLTEKPERTPLVYSTLSKFSGGFKKNTPKTTGSVQMPSLSHLKTYGIIAVAIILLVGVITSISGKVSSKSKEDISKVFAEANQKFDEGTGYLSANEKERALKSFDEAEILAEKAKGKKEFKSQSEELLTKINTKQDEVLGVVSFKDKEFANLENLKATGLLGLQKIGDNFYGINSNTGAAYEIKVESGESKEIKSEYSFEGKPLSATAIDSSSKIVIITDAPALYEFDIENKEYTKLSVSGGMEKGTDLNSFGSNIYVLNTEEGQVYKHIKITGGYGQKSNYLKTATESNVKEGVSIAIDGSLYILSSDGRMTKYASGTQETFEIKGLPQSLKGANKVYANSDTKGLYILNKDSKTILVINEKNEFVKQIKSDSFSDLKGIFVGADNIIYALSGAKVYKITQ